MATHVDRDNAQTAIEVVTAFMEHGSHTADLVARFLKLWQRDLGFRRKPKFPTPFLVELGSILCVASWQVSGIIPDVNDEFPPWTELLSDLVVRFCDEPLSFCRDHAYQSTSLDRSVVNFWFRHFSWSAPTQLGVEVAVPAIEDDGLLDELAKFLWTHRHLND